MKKRLHDRKRLLQFALAFCLILMSNYTSWGQQVIGSYPVMDGGFEAQTVGTLPATVTGTVFSTWTYGTSGTTAISNTGSGTTGPRTGSKYAVVTVNSTSTGRQLLSPMTQTTLSGSHVVQYYTRNAVNMSNIPVGIGPTGSGYVGDGKNTTTTWSKVTQVVAPTSTTSATSYLGFRTKLALAGTGGFDVDDVVIYAGSAADVTAPEAATAAATPVSGTTVSWGAPSIGDVDGGGYMVVRYATNPNPDNDPNQNGIYAVGNTITNGTSSLTGTVVYLGTGTFFTDAVAGSVSGSDYYKIYTVDKAFNYATEIIATAVVSSTPTITSSSELLTGFNYTGAGPSASQSFAVSGSNLTSNLGVSTESTDFELSADNFATAGVSTITLSGATVASTTISVRLKANLLGGVKSATVSITSSGSNILPPLSLSGSVTNVFYYNGSGLVSSNTSWGANSNGTGANPSDVTAIYTNFVIANGNATTNAPWTLGSNSKVIVGNGSAVTLTVADTFPIIGTIDVTASSIVVWKHLLSSPTFGILDNASEVHFQPATAASYSFGATTAYGKLFIDGLGEVSVSNTASTPTVKTALTVASGSTLSFSSNNSPTISINSGATATINGTVKTSKPAGLFVAGGSIPLNAAATLVLGTSSTIEFSRTGSLQTVTALPAGVSYANLILSDGGAAAAAAKTIAAPFTVNGTLTINLATPAFSTISAASNITMANGATVVMTSGVLGAIPSFANGSKFNVTYTGNGKTQIIGATTASSTNVTLTSSNAAIVAGMTVTGTPIPAGTTVASISGTALVLSAAATAGSTTATLTFGTAVPQSTGVDLPTVANDALDNLTFDNTAGVVLSSAVKANAIITSKSNTLTLSIANFLDANVQVNGASELTLNVSANQANLKQIVFSGATTAKLKLIATSTSTIVFANSSAQNWGTGTVEITGFVEGNIRFGTTNAALTSTQLGLIKDMNDPSKTFKLSDQGYLYYSTTIVPGDAFVVTSANPVNLAIGVASTYSITATNSPTSFVLADPTTSPLPVGLTLNASTGAIGGTPTVEVNSLSVPISISNSVNTNTINFTFNVRTRTSQTITWNDDLSGTRTYGDAAIVLTATTNATGLSVSYSSSDTAVAAINGSTLTIVGPGTTTITASQAGNADYNPATNFTKQLVVNAKALSISGAVATDKVYNQSTTATITGTLAGGLVGADVVTLVLSGTFADANAGENKPVTSTSTLTGADAAKYSLTQPTGLFATISKKAQTLAGLGGQSVHIIGDADYFPYALVTDANATAVASVDIENPNYTYSSDNLSVATVVTNAQGKQMIHIVGLGTSGITASLSGTDNFIASLPVTHTLTVLPVPLASWDLYNFNVTSTSPQATSYSATQNVGGLVTPTITTGNLPTSTTLPYGSRYRFNSTDWPYLASTDLASPSIDLANGKYMEVVIVANSENNMSLSSINASFRGAGSVTNQMLSQFAYSTDGATFTAIGTPTTFNITSGIKYYSSIDLSGIVALQNLPSGTTVTLRYYASGKYGTGAPTTNNGRQWGFSSDFTQNNTRALIIGGAVTRITTTWNGTAWSNGVPTASVEAIIAGNYSTTANGAITAKKVTVNSGVLTVNSGNLTVQDELINNTVATAVVFENNANLIQASATTVNANTGAITVKRNSSPLYRLDYTMWSSPVVGQNLLAFSPATLATRFYNYNTSYNVGGVNGTFSVIASPSSTTFSSGSGYLIRMPNTYPLSVGYDAGSTTIVYPGVFTGVPNNGSISVPLVDGLATGLRYNLVGNPYPSPIKMQNFVFDNASNIESTLYFWRKTNGLGTAYCTWVAGSLVTDLGTFTTNGNAQSVNPLDIIQTGQGFFVEAKSGAISLDFKNGQRVNNNDGQFFRTNQVAEPSKIWLNATNAAGDFSQMAVTYFDGAAIGVDAFDGKYINDSGYALTSIINGGEYTIQGRPAFDVSDVVALNFKTTVAGDYTIAIDHFDGVFTGEQAIYLKDNTTGIETDLKAGSYTFTATAGIDNARFSLKYQRTLNVDVPVFNENSVKVYKNNGTIYVNSGKIAINSIQVYDVQGRLIAERKNVKSSTATLENLKTNNQVLLVKISGEDNSVVTKKVLN